MGFFVPKTLQQRPNWILWRLEYDAAGKAVKTPSSALYKGRAKVNDPLTWTDYGTAVMQQENGEYNGVGFVFDRAAGLVFIDLDHCITEDGEPNPFAAGIIALFPKTYIEYSQSETGLHIVCRGTIPAAYKSPEIEIYNNGRYMAFTGNTYTAAEPAAAQNALNAIIDRFNVGKGKIYREAQKAPENGSRTPTTGNDSDIIDAAERGGNAAAFKRLFAGQWQDQYSSQSEADLRLISIIFYYSRDAEQTKRIFRCSGLGQRDKAKREDYLQGLIAAAETNMPAAETWNPGRRVKNPKQQQQKKIIRRYR